MDNSENNSNTESTARGAIIEFDFTAINGAEMLFEAAKAILAPKGVELGVKLEAKYLAGNNAQSAIAELFNANSVVDDPAAAARDLTAAFAAAATEAMPGAFTPGFVAFVKGLAEKGLKVVLSTRGDTERLAKLVEERIGSPLVVAYSEPSTTYGSCKWDAWRRAATQNGLADVFTAAITGSGYGVKSALVANLAVAAIENPHTAYQDFGGADIVAEKFDAALAKDVLAMLHL
ncbi:MAG: hypothetical protein IJ802_00500 [Kiritimatiellae bacterium]|nr:hypothetical protein [Kiritimatiellia bacterium]